VRKIVTYLHVRAISAKTSIGQLQAGWLKVRCVVGRGGRRDSKYEGDGSTPVGWWGMEQILFRADRVKRPVSQLPVASMARGMGWCDDPGDRNYNRAIRLPYPASHERLWRTDSLYDVVVILSHNRRPRIRGRGSAVFFHLADCNGRPTAGCIAVAEPDMRKILAVCGPKTRLVVWPSNGQPGRGFRKSPNRP